MELPLFIINLDERKDKYQEILKELNKVQLEKYKFKIERFSAIKEEKGWIGCALSHIEILKIARERNFKEVIVLEDDNVFIDSQIKNIEKTLDWLFSNKEKWEIFMGNQTFSNIKEVYSAKKGIVKSIGKTTNFMIYQKITYNSIINHEELYLAEINNNSGKKLVNAIDRIIRNKLLVTRVPFITSQRASYSDIERKKISYVKIIKESEYKIKKTINNFKINFIRNKKILILDYNDVLTYAFKKCFDKNKYYQFIYININDIDFLDYEKVNFLFQTIQPYYLINNLEISSNIFQTHFGNIEMLQNNITINFNILKAAYDNNVTKVVSLLSNSIFHDNTDKDLYVEDDIERSKSHSSIMQYSYSKMVLLKQSEIYRKKYGKNFICVLPVDYYGPGKQDFDMATSKVIPGLIHRYINAKRNNEDFVWLNQCENVKRQFIFSYDLAKLLFWVLIDYKKNNLLILSPTEEEITIYELGDLISDKVCNKKLEQKIGYKYAKGVNRKSVSNETLLYYLSNFEFTPLKTGLNKTIDWIINNYDLLVNQVNEDNDSPQNEEVLK